MPFGLSKSGAKVWSFSGTSKENDENVCARTKKSPRTRQILYSFNIETERTEAVVAADHCTHGILHPAVIEIALATGQGFHKLSHGRPCRRTHAIWTSPVNRNPLLTLFDIASMFDGVLVFLHQVRINGLADSSNAYFVHAF